MIKFECRLPRDHFVSQFMACGAEISDAYDEYWFAGGVFVLTVVADKKIKIELRQGTLYPNLYFFIIGKSSLSRKSTVVEKVESMLRRVLPELSVVPTEFSPEAFTEHMSGCQHTAWIRDEASGVLSLMKKDYMRGFKDSLMQLYDCRSYNRKLRTSQRKEQTEFNVNDPYLNVLFATTDASLAANTNINDTLSGFLARFLFFFPTGIKSRWMPLEEGTVEISCREEEVLDQLSGIVRKMQGLEECTALHLSAEAAKCYTDWQRDREAKWVASDNGEYQQIYSRLAPMVVKLAMLFELGSSDFDVSRPIRVEFIQEACRLVDDYFMPTAIAIYEIVGSNAEKNVIDRITLYLKSHNGKATKRDILKATKIKSDDFESYISTMVESGTVNTEIEKHNGRGRDSVWVILLSDHQRL